MKHLASGFAAVLMGLPTVSAVPPALSVAPVTRAHGCGDLLAAMGRKPLHLVFIRCTYRPNAQGRPLHALYRVQGRYAAATEAYFVRRARLTPLKRSCCQWDGPAGQLHDTAGRDVTIAMASAETGVKTRVRWREIPAFEVIVEAFTEEI